MSRINIELTIDGDAEHAYRAIDHLLDAGVIQDAIDAVRVEGSRPVRVTGAIAVQVIIPRALHRAVESSFGVKTTGRDGGDRYEFATRAEAVKFADTYNSNAKATGLRSRATVDDDRVVDRGAARMRETSNDLPPASGEIGSGVAR